VLDEARVVRLLPDAVIHLDHLKVPDLELCEPLLDQLGIGFLREGGPNEFQWPVEPKRCCGASGRDYKTTTRNAVHGLPRRALPTVENHSVDDYCRGAFRLHRELMLRRETRSAVDAGDDVNGYAQRPKRQAKQIASAATQIALAAKSLRTG